jgi:hypothetical protein
MLLATIFSSPTLARSMARLLLKLCVTLVNSMLREDFDFSIERNLRGGTNPLLTLAKNLSLYIQHNVL